MMHARIGMLRTLNRHVERVLLHLDDSRMRHGLRDRPSRPRRHRLQRAVGTRDELLDDGAVQNPFGLDDVKGETVSAG
jgi:hypothetical protein